MGSSAASTAESPVKIFWQERPVKYKITRNESVYTVEELRTPWDLYIEGAFFDSEIGDPLHQTMVAERVERIFSIRNSLGNPVGDILTKPERAPLNDLSYGGRRVFHTSAPITVDGDKLVVLDVISRRGHRASDPVVSLAKDFYLAMGGQLRGEHPNGLAYKDKHDVKFWRGVEGADFKLDIMISTEPIKNPNIDSKVFHAASLGMAKSLLDARWWKRLHLNGEEPWASEVLNYIEKDSDRMPEKFTIYGEERAKALVPRIHEIIGNRKKT